MNQNKIFVTIFCWGLAILSLTACTKQNADTGRAAEEMNFSNSSLVQVYMAIVGATKNYVYVDGNAYTGAALSSGSLFPSSGYAPIFQPG
jgi:hypothetical protein